MANNNLGQESIAQGGIRLDAFLHLTQTPTKTPTNLTQTPTTPTPMLTCLIV